MTHSETELRVVTVSSRIFAHSFPAANIDRSTSLFITATALIVCPALTTSKSMAVNSDKC